VIRLAAVALLLPCAALAWQGHRAPDGQFLRWSFSNQQLIAVRLVAPPPSLRLKAGSDLRTALTSAAEAWQAVETAHAPVRVLEQVAPRQPQRGEVLVSFETAAVFPPGRDAAGFTELFLEGHDITAAHVHLNAADFDWATDGSQSALDVQTVATEHLGHSLGLAHPCGDLDTDLPSCATLPAALLRDLQRDVMFASLSPGPRRALSQDDRDGLTALLPAVAPEVAPELLALLPRCLETATAAQLTLRVGRAPKTLVRLELYQSGVFLQSWPLQRSAKGELYVQLATGLPAPPARLDALLVADSEKAGALLGALELSHSCKAGGCAGGGASLLALAPLVLFALRRKRTLLLALLFAEPALAYKRTLNSGGLCIWWDSRGHSFMIDARGTPDVAGDAAFTAIRTSFQTWSSATCSDLSFPDQGLSMDPRDRVVGYFPRVCSGCGCVTPVNRNLVLFRTANCRGGIVPAGDSCQSKGGCGNKYDCWDRGDGVLATTTTTSNSFTGQIYDADIEVNDSPAADGSKFIFTALDGPVCTGPNQTGCIYYDVQNTITHEAGHSLGLDHSLDPTATMYASAPQGETSKRTLHADDLQAICDIYPRSLDGGVSRTVTCLGDPITLTTVAGSSGGCSQAQIGSGAALAAFLFLLQRKRRSKRKPQLAMIASSAAASASLRPNGNVS
jgi:hypothetical protein